MKQKKKKKTLKDKLTYFEVSVEALILKNLALASCATAFASIVLPFPGGPNMSKPCEGASSPTNRSGRREGKITSSLSACLAPSSPTTSSKVIGGPLSTISLRIISAILGSTLVRFLLLGAVDVDDVDDDDAVVDFEEETGTTATEWVLGLCCDCI